MEVFDAIRKRKGRVNGEKKGREEKRNVEKENKSSKVDVDNVEAGTYWLTRIVLLRSLSFIYLVGFAVAANQNKQLLGKNGLLPSDLYLKRIESHFSDTSWRKILHVPTLLLYTDKSRIDEHLDLLAYTGMLFSGVVVVFGCANMFIMTLLWVLYHSIVNIGQRL